MDLPMNIAHPARCFHHPTLNTVVVVTKTRRNILQCLTAGRLNIADTVYCSALQHRRLTIPAPGNAKPHRLVFADL